MRKRSKQKILDIVGPENVLDSDLDRFGYSYDSSFVPLLPANKPDLVVRPLTTEEVSKLMAVAYEHAIPVTPRGAASGRTGGSIPLKGGISLCLDRMTRIIELDEGNMMVTAEAGVRTIDLYNHCAARGLFYPPDPASWKFSTIGGNVAENAGGMRAVKYGVTTNYVMGLEVVLADGTILQTGGKAIKNVTGYDLKSLFTGSEGTLGIITRVLLRLIPMPKKRGTLQVMFRSLDDGCATIHRMLQAGVVPAAAEIMDRVCLEAVARHRKTALDRGRSRPASSSRSTATATRPSKRRPKRIEAVANQCGAIRFRVAQSQQESDELWAIRRGLSSAVAALAPNRLGEDISVPRDAFPEVVRRIRAISEKYRLPIAVYGHAGDGNLHPSVLCDLNNPEEAERVHQAVDEIFAAALAVGGTLSGEHGIGITKRPYIAQALGRGRREDPHGREEGARPEGDPESREDLVTESYEDKEERRMQKLRIANCSRNAKKIVSQCDRCGACLPVCPLFGARDVEASSARGKNAIARALAEGGIEPTPEVLAAVNFCLLCRACVENCPSKVKTDEAMIDVRQYLVDQTGGAEREIPAGGRPPEEPRPGEAGGGHARASPETRPQQRLSPRHGAGRVHPGAFPGRLRRAGRPRSGGAALRRDGHGGDEGGLFSRLRHADDVSRGGRGDARDPGDDDPGHAEGQRLLRSAAPRPRPARRVPGPRQEEHPALRGRRSRRERLRQLRRHAQAHRLLVRRRSRSGETGRPPSAAR